MPDHIFVTLDDLMTVGWFRQDDKASIRLANGTILTAMADNAPGVMVDVVVWPHVERTRCQTLAQVIELIRQISGA